MASKQSERLTTQDKACIAALGANSQMPLGEMRALLGQHDGDVTAEPGGVDYIETDAEGLPAMWTVPEGCLEDRVLLCSHGGGYVACSRYTHRKLFGHVAKAVGCRALIVDYGLAPESLHPGPVNDMATAYGWLLGQGIKPNHIALTGDSAGGGLANTTILRASERGLPLPAATMPLSPWLDMDAGDGTFETNKAKDVLNSREIIAGMSMTFLCKNGNRRDPLANPLLGDLRGLPPSLHPGGQL